MIVIQKQTKQLGIFLSVLLIFAQLAFIQPVITHAITLDQAVTITAIQDDSDEAVIETTAVKINEGSTAWDVLKNAADNLDFNESEWGKMLQGINGVIADFDENGQYWGFFVNGKLAPVG